MIGVLCFGRKSNEQQTMWCISGLGKKLGEENRHDLCSGPGLGLEKKTQKVAFMLVFGWGGK